MEQPVVKARVNEFILAKRAISVTVNMVHRRRKEMMIDK